MKIVQVTPGVIPIPPNGWGAVEKIIWEYKKSLDKMGYPVQIKWTDDVVKGTEIPHVHMANLALLLHQRGIEYVFSLHDHHVEYFGRESECWKKNYEAIKNSKLTFVHAKHLIPLFDNLPQIVYLPHGANLEDYQFVDRSARVRQRPHKLLMMANNGVGGDNLIDRKGFLFGIEAAKKLNLEISIICPRKANEEFFNHHKPDYDKLTIYYDLDHKAGLELMKEYDIFLHPSNLEAGHPNLTIVEAVVSGMPVVGCLDNHDLPGMIRVERDLNRIVFGVIKAIDQYDSLVNSCFEGRDFYSWDIVATRMLNEIKVAFNISEREQLIYNYQTTQPVHKEKLGERGLVSNFKAGKAFVKNSIFTEGATNIFKDRKTGKVIYWSETSKKPASWAYTSTGGNEFWDLGIEVRQGVNLLHKNELNLSGKRILIQCSTITNNLISLALKLQEVESCFITLTGTRSPDFPVYDSITGASKLCFHTSANPEEFYYTMTDAQLFDYFVEKPKLEEKILLELSTGALGDTIGFVPYAQKWAQTHGKIAYVSIKFPELFNPDDYPNLRFIDRNTLNRDGWTDVYRFDYFYDRPLQRGYSDQFGLEWRELRTRIKKVGGDRPIKGKYVCIGVHSTAQCKYWNYPGGWDILCKRLRKMGYTPVSLDMNEVFGIEGHWNEVPGSCLKKIGMSLDEIILYLQHSEFFIGLSSGLAWLAWGVGKPVVMISGTTAPENEFLEDCIRIHRTDVCHSCFNKVTSWKFNPGDWLWCPEGRDTEKWFQCTKSITPDMVLEGIKGLNPKSVTKELL